MGYSYLEDSEDTRNSPSESLVRRLRELGAEVAIHDPWVPEFRGELLERLHGCDAAVLMVAHRAYRDVDLASLKSVLRTPILVDGRHLFSAEAAARAGLSFYTVGVAPARYK